MRKSTLATDCVPDWSSNHIHMHSNHGTEDMRRAKNLYQLGWRKTQSETGKEWRNAVVSLAKHNKVIMQSVNECQSIRWKERADFLAKEESRYDLIGSEPTCRITYRSTKKNWRKQQNLKHRMPSLGLKQFRMVIERPSAVKTEELLQMPRKKVNGLCVFLRAT